MASTILVTPCRDLVANEATITVKVVDGVVKAIDSVASVEERGAQLPEHNRNFTARVINATSILLGGEGGRY